MSVKSKAQLARLRQLHMDGKITSEKLKEYVESAPKDLPDRVAPKPKDPNKWPKEKWPRRGK